MSLPPAKTPVTLVPLSVAHLSHVMTWVNDREVMQYFANRQTTIGEEEERGYLESLVRSKNDRAYSVFASPPAAPATAGSPEPPAPASAGFAPDAYVGQCSINQIYWPAKNGRLFVVVRREAQGKGYGPAAIAKLLEIAWNDLGLHKVWLIVRKDNRAAQAMYLKLGFDFEGVLADEYCVNGVFFDMVRMAIRRPRSP